MICDSVRVTVDLGIITEDPDCPRASELHIGQNMMVKKKMVIENTLWRIERFACLIAPFNRTPFPIVTI